MYARRNMRDKTGANVKNEVKRGSYAEQRLMELKQERDLYNVNHLGYYKGGVPQRRKGAVRGLSIGQKGEFHDPGLHNYLHHSHPDSTRVTSDQALQFKAYMYSDKADFNMTVPQQPMYYDNDMNFKKDRDFYLKFLLSCMAATYGINRYWVEVDRARRAERMEGFKNSPGHHFENRGGVVSRKQFTGFEKYFQNQGRLEEWTMKAYPQLRELD